MSKSPFHRLVSVSACLWMCGVPLCPAIAELTGADRESFLSNFDSGCLSSKHSAALIGRLGGTAPEREVYCDYVGNSYADRLFSETIFEVREIERLAIADWSRQKCIDRVLSIAPPDHKPDSGMASYPADADVFKSTADLMTDQGTRYKIFANGRGASTQLVFFDTDADLFCWSRHLSIEDEIRGSSPQEPALSVLWCEGPEAGYAEIFRVSQRTCNLGFAFLDGRVIRSAIEVAFDQ